MCQRRRRFRGTSVIARLPIEGESAAEGPRTEHALFLISVDFTEGEAETYAVPLSAVRVVGGEESSNEAAIFRITDGIDRHWLLQDGMTNETFARGLLRTAMESETVEGKNIKLHGRPIGEDASEIDCRALAAKVPDREQSNTNIVFGDQLILKLYRRIADGINPELEIGEHLTAKVGFAHSPPLAGAIELQGRGPSQTLATVLTYVPNQGDAWGTFLDQGQRYFEGLAALTAEEAGALCLPGDEGCTATDAPPADIASLIAEPLELARLLGRRTAEMHAALADDHGNSAFTPEPYSAVYQRGLLQSMRNTTRSAMQTLSKRINLIEGDARAMADDLLKREGDVQATFKELTGRPIRAPRIRVHGDYHLGQVLWTGKDFCHHRL